MKRRHISAAVTAIAVLMGAVGFARGADEKPNIVYILADDQGCRGQSSSRYFAIGELPLLTRATTSKSGVTSIHGVIATLAERFERPFVLQK